MPKSKHIMPFHDHPLYIFDGDQAWFCFLCQLHEKRGIAYLCMECELVLHKECVEAFINHGPFQCNHSLTLSKGSPFEHENPHCHFCRKNLSSLYARCTICNISMDMDCVKNPPPLTLFQPKHHKHSLTLLLRLVTFTCNACGVEGDRNPYVCLECNLMVHKDCIDLPRVITINRHDHRISHTFHLGQGEGDWECGVCRKKIDWVYGAFKCSRCPSYAVHSKCATRKEVWDGIELEDVPEEEEEIEDPYKIINEKDIIHFSHENHILRLDENCAYTDMRCEGCVLPIYADPCYKCVECDFILHKACANLPRKKRHLLHNHKLVLRVDEAAFNCRACRIDSNGFRYKCEEGCKDKFVYDVRCSSVSEPFRHDLHPHPLYWTLEGSKECQGCDTKTKNPLSCTVCEYALCMTCATLPRKVKHRCDDHFLSLRQGVGNSSGDLWCDICEFKADPNERYYTCVACGVTLDIYCVLGDFYYLKIGQLSSDLEVLPNNGATRPLCSGCKARCKFPFLVKNTTQECVRYFCKLNCLHYY